MPRLNASPEAYINDKCQKCNLIAPTFQCMVCQAIYCESCASPHDPENFCKHCLTETSVELKVEPLIDDEGVTHEGRRIIPIGDTYKTIPTVIGEMSLSQVETHIEKYKALVKQAEQSLEYRRIHLNIAQVHKDGLEEAERRHLRGIKSVGYKNIINSQIGKTNGKAQVIAAPPDPTKMADFLKAAGISPEKFIEMMKNMAVKK